MLKIATKTATDTIATNWHNLLKNNDFEAAGEMLWKQVQDPVARSFEKTFKKTASGEFLEELKELLTALRKAIKALPDWAAVGLTIKEVLESREGDWRAGFIPLFQGLFEEWADQWSIELGVDFALSKPLVQEFIAKHAFQFVNKHQVVTRDAIANLVSVATADGYSVKEFRDQLTSIYGQWSELRAEMIARTETIRAENAGALAAYQSAGVERVQWWTARDDRVCPFCGKLHGKIFKTGEPLFVVGDVFNVDGQNLKLNYDDVRYPPLHVFCRCVLLPVIGDVSDQVDVVEDAKKVPDAQRARENISQVKLETEAGLQDITLEMENKSGKRKQLISDMLLASREGDIDKRNRIQAELSVLSDDLKALSIKFAESKNNELLKTRELVYVDNPSTPNIKFKKRGLDKDRRQVWENGSREFTRMVSFPSLNGVDIEINKGGSGRSYYYGGDVWMATGASERTLIHELGHAFELSDPTINQKALEFLNRRTEGEKPQRLSKLTGNSSYDKSEVAKPDKFFSPYVGKIYRDKATEIVSMGLEEMWSDPAGFAEKDPDYFDFIYNLVRGI